MLKNKKGFTLFELLLVLAVAGIILIVVLVLYNLTIKPSSWINEKTNAFSGLVSALEQSRTINGGGYPKTGATAISDLGNLASAPAGVPASTVSILKSLVGTSNGNLKNWQYKCNDTAASPSLDITVYVGDDSDADRQNTVKTYISQNFSGSGFTCGAISSGSFTCSKGSVLCK